MPAGERPRLPARLARTGGHAHADALNDLLPVDFDASKPEGLGTPSESHIVLTDEGAGHLLTMLAPNDAENSAIWKNLPGFYWCAAVSATRPGSEVLAVHSTLRNAEGRIPLLVTRPFGNGKVLFMGTDGAWRWRLGVEDKYHYRFWGQVIRWMAHQRHLAQGESIRLSFSPETPRVGDTVSLLATVFDSGGLPDLAKGKRLRPHRHRQFSAPGGAPRSRRRARRLGRLQGRIHPPRAGGPLHVVVKNEARRSATSRPTSIVERCPAASKSASPPTSACCATSPR